MYVVTFQNITELGENVRGGKLFPVLRRWTTTEDPDGRIIRVSRIPVTKMDLSSSKNASCTEKLEMHKGTCGPLLSPNAYPAVWSEREV